MLPLHRRLSVRPTRRLLLRSLLPVASLAALLTACGEDDPTFVQVTATPDPAATPVPIASAVSTPPPEPLTLQLPRQAVAQGGTFVAVLKAENVVSAYVEFAGRTVQTIRENGFRMAVVPTGQRVGDVEQVPPGQTPITMVVQQTLNRGPQELTGSVTVRATEYPVAPLTLTPQVSSLLDPVLTEQELAVIRPAYGGVTPVRLWDGFFVRPSTAAVTDVYGSRRSYNGGPATGSHSGVDFGANSGTPVLAAAAGRVTLTQALPVRGNMVIVDHGAGVFSGYSHLSRFDVRVGQDVRPGQPIALSGATGLVTGPNLHWEVVAGGMHVDGLRWLQV